MWGKFKKNNTFQIKNEKKYQLKSFPPDFVISHP